ncbi:hypothetical protein Tco_0660233 [Tanacetum coccineum]
MEAFIGGLPQSIEGNVTALKPQTMEEATNIAHRLMDQIIKRNSVQETNDHKRKFDDRRNTTNNNNYSNNLITIAAIRKAVIFKANGNVGPYGPIPSL